MIHLLIMKAFTDILMNQSLSELKSTSNICPIYFFENKEQEKLEAEKAEKLAEEKAAKKKNREAD